MLSRLFSKHGLVPLATHMQINKKSEIVDMKRIGIVQCRTVYSVTRHAVGITVNKQGKGIIQDQCVD